jgi:YesN/AraC family two-component response regulator
MNFKELIQKEIFIKNMLCRCCERIVREDLQKFNVQITKILSPFVEILYNPYTINLQQIDAILQQSGMGIVVSREQRLVEQAKQAVIELIHHLNNMDSMVRKSDYLVEKLGVNYQHLSKLFSKYEDTTLEKFIIQNKIMRIKELIMSDEYSLSEIAYMMDYSSVQYLSNQFKKETGMTVSEFKNGDF